MKNYIKKQQEKLKRKRVGNIDVFIKDAPEGIDSLSVIAKAIKKIPTHLVSYIDTIYVGKFDHLLKRDLDASYSNGMMFLTNDQKSEADMMDDIVHEFAHSVEEMHNDEIYGDLSLQREFLQKRKRLYQLLKSEGFEVDNYSFDNPKYDYNFDAFLYKEVTYSFLRSLTTGLFYSPYAATSLSEYFANGFEAVFYGKESNKLKQISPILLEKINNLL